MIFALEVALLVSDPERKVWIANQLRELLIGVGLEMSLERMETTAELLTGGIVEQIKIQPERLNERGSTREQKFIQRSIYQRLLQFLYGEEKALLQFIKASTSLAQAQPTDSSTRRPIPTLYQQSPRHL
jgi:hypothetical protein